MLKSRRWKHKILVRERTFCSIARLVIFGEPLQILVFNPGNPAIVLAVVELASLLFVCLGLGILVVVCHVNEFSSLCVRRVGRCEE